ncbi:tyrosine-type recombinase/integrase [Pseudoalteromonas piratica]|nr:site-specific integrase [Pseudoalteromonas piratica]
MKNFVRIKGKLLSDGMALMNVHTSEYYEPFEAYVRMLLDKEGATTTTKQYAEHVSRFLDFLYEYQTVAIENQIDIVASRLFANYEKFLIKGKHNDDELLKQVAKNLNKTKNTSHVSISQGIESALNYFLEMQLFNNVQEEHFDFLTYTSEITTKQKAKIKKNSWLSATTKLLSASKPKIKRKLFPKASKRANKNGLNNNKEKAYRGAIPANSSIDFFTHHLSEQRFNKFSVVRDLLMYSFLATSGVRQSECLQITVDDIDFDKREIRIVNPFTRTQIGLTEKEEECLSWKGRVTEKTFLIQPFAHIFWGLLETYLSTHYKTNVNHRYLFQKLNGRPFFAADRSERSKTFKKYLRAVDQSLGKHNLHGFRHLYGFYVYNYLPIVNSKGEATGEQGMPLGFVKILMGHAQISSTEVYAREDIDLIEFVIASSNSYIRKKGITPKQLLSQYYTKQMKMLESKLEEL